MRGKLEHQYTIAVPAATSGIGLHTGVAVNLRLTPAPANTGLIFKRTDLDGFEIAARARNVARVSYATSLMRKGVLISTTEHLLSALAATGVDNVYVEIDNLEIPILDGSALPFVALLRRAGLRRQRGVRTYAKVVRPVEIVEGAKRIAVYPADRFAVSYRIAFPHPLIGEQSFEYRPGAAHAYGTNGTNGTNGKGNAKAGAYESQIAPARTFGFYEEVERLRQSGLVRGGSLENAVVLSRDGVMNPEGLRFRDEFCRHKILDLIGDLAMLGRPLVGHVVAERAGHAMHAALVARLLREKSAWTVVTSEELEAQESLEAPAPVQAARLA
ncbi:MAG TPA: UDP-3-O-acyl-N-acetylglucosamine deacetylase [Terriglobia bacterium]|nr:UDP-3-O-acyl-N-acetylglucosamine deacetylase [Terriglobia bacterium]